jgi:small subunit ribosomal protein S8
MSMSDPIADLLTRIRNATMARHRQVSVPNSKLKLAIVRVLKEEGFIERYQVVQDPPRQMIRIWLKYDDEKKPVLSGLKRVSKPGCRIYSGRNNIPWVYSGLGVAILSTSKGVVTDSQARHLGIGGEVLCHIW